MFRHMFLYNDVSRTTNNNAKVFFQTRLFFYDKGFSDNGQRCFQTEVCVSWHICFQTKVFSEKTINTTVVLRQRFFSFPERNAKVLSDSGVPIHTQLMQLCFQNNRCFVGQYFVSDKGCFRKRLVGNCYGFSWHIIGYDSSWQAPASTARHLGLVIWVRVYGLGFRV